LRPVYRWLRLDPVLVVALTLLCAAILVVHLQRRALIALDQQSTVVLQKIVEQTAAEIALDIRAAIEEPAYDILGGFTRAELQAGGLDRVLRRYQEAFHEYPQIDRFFVWSEQTEARAPGEVLFFDGLRDRQGAVRDGDVRRPSAGAERPVVDDLWSAFWRDRELGTLIYQGILTSRLAQKNYTALEYRLGDCTYDIPALSWLEPERDRYFFLLGFVVCLERGGKRLLSDMYGDRLADRLSRSDGGARLELHVFDEQRRLIFGSAQVAPGIAASVAFPAQFSRPRLSSSTNEFPPREWTVRVSSSSPGPPSIRAQSQWLLGLSVLLMLVALTVAIRGQKRASELASMQAEFVSHVSHQLRTPLSLLTTVADTLALDRVKSPEKLARYVDIMRTETKQLSTLVERILEFSRVDGQGRTYQLESVDLVPLVRESVDAFAEKPAAQGFAIRVLDDGSSPAVQADPAALEQALVNLLDNAVKYSDRSRDVMVRVRRSAGEAVVEVEDGGIGIDAVEQLRIFDRFYRGRGAGQRSGFGLGLAIVKEIVRAHGGRIEVESTPGRGSVFRVRLPLPNSARRIRFRIRGRAVAAPRPPEVTST